jgi:hypothetical protein
MFGIGVYLRGEARLLERRAKDRTDLINASLIVTAAVNIDDLFEQGKLLATTFDRVVIYEDAYIRGRQPGEITALISRGIEAGMRADRPTTIQAGGTWCEAAALVLVSPASAVRL